MWEVTSPVPGMDMVCAVVTLLLMYLSRIVQADVSNTFLHGKVDTNVYMYQLEGYKKHGKICKLLKGQYGMQQAGQLWNRTICKFIIVKLGFQHIKKSCCVFVANFGNIWVVIVLYVDDLIIGSNNNKKTMEIIQRFKVKFGLQFDEGLTTYLGVVGEVMKERRRKERERG